jgi:hypothetical protein
MSGDLERRVRRLERWNGFLVLALLAVGGTLFAHGGGGFALHGPEAKGAAVLYLKGDGNLTFFGAEGEVQARYRGG